MPTHKVDLTALPEDQSAVPGYETILAAHQKLAAALDSNHDLSASDLEATLADARQAMTAREREFLHNLQGEIASFSADLRFAKLTGGLYKILMDRKGFKVSKEGGGLG